jgi:hypothetical protein
MNPSQVKLAGILLVIVAASLSVVGVRALKGITSLRATTAVRVERDQGDLSELRADAAAAFMQNEARTIESEIVLAPVVEKLDLNRVWAERYAGGQTLKSQESLQMLKARIRAQPLPNSTLIEIQASSETADEAVKLAEAVAKEYCEYRGERVRQRVEPQIEALDREIRRLAEAVRLAQDKAEAAKSQLDPDALEPAVLGVKNKAWFALRDKRSQAALHYMAATNQLASLKEGNAQTNLIPQVEARVSKTASDLAEVETAMRAAIRDEETVNTYRAAQREWKEANDSLSQANKNLAEFQARLRSPDKPPAVIAEPAAISRPDEGKAARGKQFLLGGGLVLAAGLVLILFPTLVAAKPQA